MKKIILILMMAILISIAIEDLPISALSNDDLEKIIIQEYQGENAVFTSQREINEIVKVLRESSIEISDIQNIKLEPDLYIIEDYENRGTLTFGLIKGSQYIKCDIEGDIYWYKVPIEKKDEVYKAIKEKLKTNIEANK
ncbi:MAG: hypothetical protein ACRDA3_00690 [Peptostreptococcaceae bacterium]